jgi:hypothetical protein
MSTTDEYGGYGSGYEAPVTGWVGWIVFAAVFMVTIGAINAIQGLAALFRDDAYWQNFQGDIVAFNITTWGWLSLLFGILLIIVGILLIQGSTFARVVGIGLVALNLIHQFGWASFYPFWGMIAIALDIVILYALIVHGGELKRVD